MPHSGPVSLPARDRPMRRLAISAVLPLLGLVSAATGMASTAALPRLRATLEDTTNGYVGDNTQRWRWQTHWVVQWRPVPGAVTYEIISMTSEGASKRTTRLHQPPFRLEVAKGDNAKAAGMPTRPIQLLTIQSLLSIRIVARMSDGSPGPSSPWLQVGHLYP